jgi:anhydro-N-acetylmuramic acid kinase
MLYKAIGIMSGSSLDGLDIAYAHLQETGGKWSFDIICAQCHAYSPQWAAQLKNAVAATAQDYQLLHTAYGQYIGEAVNQFIEVNKLHHQVDLVASHGHTSFHLPGQKMTAQLGDGAAIAASTGLAVVSDLRAMDIAFGGQGAPIVPIGEKLLLPQYNLFLNLGGIANLSFNLPGQYIAFDVCPANRVLNMLAALAGKQYDDGGQMAAGGRADAALLATLNKLDYYSQPFPKSLANDFGTGTVFPLVERAALTIPDALCTCVEHIAQQVQLAVKKIVPGLPEAEQRSMLVTGGGAFNTFLVKRINFYLREAGIEALVPDEQLVNYKEALVMALIGVLRWREEYNVLCSVTGAVRNSINGALWLGGEA